MKRMNYSGWPKSSAFKWQLAEIISVICEPSYVTFSIGISILAGKDASQLKFSFSRGSWTLMFSLRQISSIEVGRARAPLECVGKHKSAVHTGVPGPMPPAVLRAPVTPHRHQCLAPFSLLLYARLTAARWNLITHVFISDYYVAARLPCLSGSSVCLAFVRFSVGFFLPSVSWALHFWQM